MEQVRTWVLTAGAVVLALLILATLVRAVLGPRFTDRIVAVNVISTLVIAELVLLSVWLREDFLVDVALVFALLSFLAVVVVSRLGAARRRKGWRLAGPDPGHLLGRCAGNSIELCQQLYAQRWHPVLFRRGAIQHVHNHGGERRCLPRGF